MLTLIEAQPVGAVTMILPACLALSARMILRVTTLFPTPPLPVMKRLAPSLSARSWLGVARARVPGWAWVRVGARGGAICGGGDR